MLAMNITIKLKERLSKCVRLVHKPSHGITEITEAQSKGNDISRHAYRNRNVEMGREIRNVRDFKSFSRREENELEKA